MTVSKDYLFSPVGTLKDHNLAYSFGALSELAYCDEVERLRKWAEWFEFDAFEIQLTPGKVVPNFTIISSPGRIVFAIPGTNAIRQMLANIALSSQTPLAEIPGAWVHVFFKYCADQLIPYIDEFLPTDPTGWELCFCGHSLGGAVAQILARVYEKLGYAIRNVFVFNSPRVGNEAFATATRTYGFQNWWNTYDKIKELPPPIWLQAPGQGGQIIHSWCFYAHAGPTFAISLPQLTEEVLVSVGFVPTWFTAYFKNALDVATLASAGSGEVATFARAEAQFGRTLFGRIAVLNLLTTLTTIEIQGHSMRRLCAGILSDTRWTDHRFSVEGVTAGLEDSEASFPGEQPGGPLPACLESSSPIPFMENGIVIDPAQPVPAPATGSRAEIIAVNSAVITPYSPVPGVVPLSLVALGGDSLLGIDHVGGRHHWLFRGPDRDMLQKTGFMLQTIALRDGKTFSSEPTSAVSNRVPIIDIEDESLVNAFGMIQERIFDLLAMEKI